MKNKLDGLLRAYLRVPDTIKLNYLEQDVWRGIHSRSKETWLERFIIPVLTPQYRLATITLALIVGLFVGEFTKINYSAQEISARALNMQVFSVRNMNISTNKLIGNYENSY